MADVGPPKNESADADAFVLDTHLPISCILPVYHAVTPSEFIRAFRSITEQTRPIDEIIIVFDGPVHDSIRDFAFAQNKRHVTVASLPENKGVAAAMREGFALARNRWVARHDADDIALPHRFEAQWPLVSTEQYAAVGGMLLEFSGDPRNILRFRKLPTEPIDIAKYVRMNSPMNNQTAIFDSEAVAAVGGVQDLLFMEDYDLFARLIAHGYKLRALPEALVLFQTTEDVFARRTDKRMGQAERRMQKNLVSYGLISRPRSVANLLMRQAFRKLPRPALKAAYGILFDRGSKEISEDTARWLEKFPRQEATTTHEVRD